MLARVPIFLVTFFAFLQFTPLCLTQLPSLNLVQRHIQIYSNFSVDPCEDFYAHACPSSAQAIFLAILREVKRKFVNEFKENHPEFLEFDAEKIEETIASAEEIVKSNKMENLCKQKKSSKSGHCKKYAAELIASINATSYEESRTVLVKAINAYAASKLLEKENVGARDLFKKMKQSILEEIKSTPWAKANKAVELFSTAVEKLKFSTFHDYKKIMETVMDDYQKSRNVCINQTEEFFTKEIASPFCTIIATNNAFGTLNQPIKGLDDLVKNQTLGDNLQMFNLRSEKVYIGNDYLFLLSTAHLSDLYGSIGFTLTHEIMHTLVFDYRDIAFENPLVPFWTRNSYCVEAQAMKTCETFPTIYNNQNPEETCTTTFTFEEDAADLAAYRIAYKEYQKSYTRKTVVPNYESLDKKQLFFYGAAIFFCDPNGMDKVEYSKVQHSNNYQRVNSLMSQMDEFADAFKCKPTDKMVMNKATHCELYGEKAPQTRKNSVGK